MSKRQRTGTGFRTVKRPIDKTLIVVSHNTTAGTQVNTTLFTCTFSCTIVGIRWSMGLFGATTTFGKHAWVVQVIRDGNSTPAIALTDAGKLAAPEQNVLAMGVGVSLSTASRSYEGKTSTMRKLLVGDIIKFSILGEATQTTSTRGSFLFFCKT